jgi:UDP-arabinose 4-epimerase
VVEPEKYYINNVAGSLSLLSAMREHGTSEIVFSSTCAVYGNAMKSRIDENHELKPINPYGVTKLTVERMLGDFSSAYGIRSVCLRYFNAAGSDPDGDIGEDHDPEPHLIPRVLDAALGRSPHIEIYGTDYETEDGSCVRDFIHVSDLAEAHVLAARRLRAGGETAMFNLGTGEGHSVKQVIATAEQVTGATIPVVERSRRPGDPPILVADPGLAWSALGWRAHRSDLRTQVEDAWSWWKAHHERTQSRG